MRAETSSASRPPSGRYYAEVVHVSAGTNPQETIQEMLDASANKKWHLVGVAGGLPEGAVILFWDTARPSFARSQGR